MARPPANTSREVALPNMDMSLELKDLSAQVAMELAAGLSDGPAIRERYGISDAQWEVLRRNPTFRNMLRESVTTLKGDLNASKRITLKAEVLLEDALPVLDSIAHNPENPPMARIAAISEMAKQAGRTGKDQEGGKSGSTFALSINIGNGQPGITIEGKPLKVSEDE